jgi:AAA domain
MPLPTGSPRLTAPVDSVLDALKARGRQVKGSYPQFTAQCPVEGHDDHNPSLRIGVGSDGRVLLSCMAGCSTDAVIDALGLDWHDLFEDTRDSGGAHQGNGSRGNGRLRLTEDDLTRFGEGLTDAVEDRLEELCGWSPVAVRTLELGLDGDRVVVSMRSDGQLVGVGRYCPRRRTMEVEGRPALYPEPESIRPPDSQLGVVNDAPDAIAGWSLGLATVSVPGANGWQRGWANRFTGRRVVVCGNCDDEGRDFARRVAADLAPVVEEVRVVDLNPGRSDGYDLSDLVRESRRFDSRGMAMVRAMGFVNGLAVGAPASTSDSASSATLPVGEGEFHDDVDDDVIRSSRHQRQTQGVDDDDVESGGLPFATIADFLASAPPEPDWRVRGYVALEALTLLAGPPKAGKSTFTYATIAAMLEVVLDTLPGFGRVVLAEEAPGALVSVVDLASEQVPERTPRVIPFDLGVVQGEDRCGVTSACGIEHPAHDLHVLLRHRPPSISP